MLSHRLRHRVEFQSPETEMDSETGIRSVTWSTAVGTDGTVLDSVPAEVLTGPGREFRAAGGKQAETDARINTRWFPGLVQTWRILWDGKTYQITGMETDRTARQEWRIECVEGVNDGE